MRHTFPHTLFLLPLATSTDHIDHLVSAQVQALWQCYRPLQLWYDTPLGVTTLFAFPSTCYNARTTGIDVRAMERELERRQLKHTPETGAALLTEAFQHSSLIYIPTSPEETLQQTQELLVKNRIKPVLLSLRPLQQPILPQLQPHQRHLLQVQLCAQLQ